MDEALQLMNKLVFAKNLEESQKTYDKLSENYDEHLVNLKSNTLSQTTKMFGKYAMDTKILLDLGGGTARIVEFLRKTGYTGIADVLDANLPMLAKGEEKNINLRNIIRHYVGEDGILPLKDESYDTVTCAGAFLQNHIPATAVKGVFNVIKKGGIFIITTRRKTTESYKAEFDKCVEELTSSGKVELLEEAEFLHCPNADRKYVTYVLKKLM